MPFEKKNIDRMEMMRILGMIYARTAAGFGKVGLQTLIRKEGGPTVRTKAGYITKALTVTGLLERPGLNGCHQRYHWNMKDYGPVSLLIADMVINETENQLRIARRNHYANRKWRKGSSSE